MRKTIAIPLFLLSLLVFVLSACKPDPVTDLDVDLTLALEAAAGSQGLDYYILPESDDYAAIPQDPNNPLTREKVELGKLLYHESIYATMPRLPEGALTYSCASCHHAQAGFQAGIQQGIGEGGIGFGVRGEARVPNPLYPIDSLDVQPIRSPTVLNSAYQELMLWNGQFGAAGANIGTEAQWVAGTPPAANHLGYEGVETQAIAGFEIHRHQVDTTFMVGSDYEPLFDYAFPEVPTTDRYTRERAGLAIAAYERTVLSNRAPFQKWLKGDAQALTDDQKKGAILFFGKAECNTCHTGPALNSMDFYALGMDDLDGPGVYGDAPNDATQKGRGGFTGVAADEYKFKVPQLYSLRYSPFYGHGGSFNSIEAVIDYKNAAISENQAVPGSQLAASFVPLGLTELEASQIANFVRYGLDDPGLERYEPVQLPSGMCFPNNDVMSRHQRGCD